MITKIFYFSGTGNSYYIAKSISEKLNQSELVRITPQQFNEDTNSIDVAGLIFPVYYFGLPQIVEEFLKNTSFNNNTYLFIVATRGIPMAGGVRRQLRKLLARKVSFFSYITMGDNFNIDFWNSSSREVKIHRNERALNKINNIVQSIRSKESNRKFTLVDFLGSVTRNFPRYGYRTYTGKVFNSDDCFEVNTENCTKCKKCIKACPIENIILNKKIEWMHQNCQLCLACYHCCPSNAIQYENGHLSTRNKRQYWNY